MKAKTVLKFTGNGLLFMFALAIYIILTAALMLAVVIPLMLLGEWIGVGNDIFVYVAMFFICLKANDVLGWITDKIDKWLERKKKQLDEEQ